MRLPALGTASPQPWNAARTAGSISPPQPAQRRSSRETATNPTRMNPLPGGPGRQPRGLTHTTNCPTTQACVPFMSSAAASRARRPRRDRRPGRPGAALRGCARYAARRCTRPTALPSSCARTRSAPMIAPPTRSAAARGDAAARLALVIRAGDANQGGGRARGRSRPALGRRPGGAGRASVHRGVREEIAGCRRPSGTT